MYVKSGEKNDYQGVKKTKKQARHKRRQRTNATDKPPKPNYLLNCIDDINFLSTK